MTNFISTYADALVPPRRATRLQGWLRAGFLRTLAGIEGGAVVLQERDREPVLLGEPSGDEAPQRVTVHAPSFYDYACLGGSVGLGEAYMLGLWDADDLVGVTRLLLRNVDRLDQLDGGLAQLKLPLQKLVEWRRRNHRDGSRLNIAAHYDLGNPFFRLFLDRDMTYSSAMYRSPSDTLEAAQRNKLDAVCRKLQLAPGEHVVEIGSGWGSFALHAASHYGVHVTTTTLSREQYDLARERVCAAGMQDRVRVLLRDYRDLDGTYDKLVSIEMVEAVGHAYYPVYMQACERLLKPNGQALIQAITCADQRYELYRRTSDFIRRYIFPGGNLPSITHLLNVTTRHTKLRLFHLDNFSADYARTLAEWRRRFWEQQAAIRGLGYSKTFTRMWDFYLATCEAAFAEHFTGVTHLLFTAPQCRREAVA